MRKKFNKEIFDNKKHYSNILKKMFVFLLILMFFINTLFITVSADSPIIINDVLATPDPQETGGYVNISCNVFHSTGGQIDTVKVNITDPTGVSTNHTMIIGSYYYNWSYTLIGVYDYFIWANDTSGNSNISTGHSFVINPLPDTEPPEILNVDASPDPQISGEYVNITCVVTDNVAVDEVWVNITDPAGVSTNHTMIIGSYYFNSSYTMVGVYDYFIWAIDTSGNSNVSLTYNFTIQDTMLPVISDVLDSPDPQESGGFVNITCVVTDNVAVDEVWVNITDPTGVSTNHTMIIGSYYFNSSYTLVGVYDYFIWAIDTSNNVNISNNYNFTIIKSSFVYVDDDFEDTTPGWQVTHFDNIQDGIDAVAENGAVYVYSGTYYENVVVNKTIKLVGENRDNTVINGGGNNDVVRISSDGINISGFTIKNSGNVGYPEHDAGLEIQSNYNTVNNNILSDNRYGIITSSSFNTDYNIIDDNIILDNNDFGIYLRYSFYNTISSNIISENQYGVFFQSSCYNNIIANKIYSNEDKGIYIAVNSNNNIVSGNNISNNIGSGPNGGILLYYSHNNIIFCNILLGNGQYGIYPDSSSDNNKLYQNNFIDNIVNSFDTDVSNFWYNTILGEGNYWSDYNGIDEDGDGIGDTPYNISGGNNEDSYPLINTFFPLHADFAYVIYDKTVSFDASFSYCTDGDIILYEWDFDDGSTGTGMFINHTYSSYDIYSVELTVTDEYGRTDSIIQNIIVDSEPPEITDNTLSNGTTGDVFSFEAKVIDNIEIDYVYVEYWYGSNPHINVSMNPIDNKNYEKTIAISSNSTQSLHYIISAVDNSGNWNNTDIKNVIIVDNDCPEISNVQAFPSKQLPDGYVNISCIVNDNIGVDEVWVNITYPDYSTNNITISGGNPYFYNVTYNNIGNYFCFFWTVDTSGNIKISSNFNFEIRENIPPYAPSNPYPENGSINVGLNVDINWTCGDPDSDPLIYDIYFGNNSSPPLVQSNWSSTSYNHGILSYETTYYWRVVAFDNLGASNSSPIWNFTTRTNNPPNIPSNPYPTKGSTNIDRNANLRWDGGDPDGDPVTYDVYFDTNYPPLIIIENNHSLNSYDPGTMDYNTTYYWQIIAWDNNAASNKGPVWKFTTKTTSSGGGGGGTTPPTPNNKPVADASAGEPYYGFVDEEIIFDASLSYDPDENDDISQWIWYFGDGKQGVGEKEGHRYSAPGEYNVILTVTDNYGAKDDYETIAKITQPNRPPLISEIQGPNNGKKNTKYNYTAFSTDADNDTIKYTFEWGDGKINESGFLPNGTPFSLNHSWIKAGRYTLTVTVTDRKTASKSIITVDIDVRNIGAIGYLIDVDSDGIYDVFHNTTTEQEINVMQDINGNYLIDNDGDGDINYIYNALSDSITPYEPYSSEDTSLDPLIVMTIIIVAIAVVILIIFVVLFKTGYIYIEKTIEETNKKK